MLQTLSIRAIYAMQRASVRAKDERKRDREATGGRGGGSSGEELCALGTLQHNEGARQCRGQLAKQVYILIRVPCEMLEKSIVGEKMPR